MGDFGQVGQAKLGPSLRERFDQDAHAVLARAQEEARALGQQRVGTEHLLLGVCCQDAEGSDAVLASAGITAQGVRSWLAQHGGKGSGATEGSLPFPPNAWFVLYRAQAEADGRQHQSISPAHVLLALIRCATVAPKAPAAGIPHAPGADAPEAAAPGTGRQPLHSSPAGPDAVAVLLSDGEIDLGALHARAAARANTASAGQGFPFIGADLAGRTCLPGRGRRRLWQAAVLAAYVPLAALDVILAPAATRVIAPACPVVAPA